MKSRFTPNSEVRAVRMRSGRLQMHPTPLMAEFCRVFESYGRAFLSAPESLAHREAALAMSGLLTEGLVLVTEAINFARACAQAVVADDGTYVQFQGVLNRPRCIKASVITQELLKRDPATWPSVVDPLKAMGAWVEAQPHDIPRDEEAHQLPPLERLEMAAAGFWIRHLPSSLFADAIAKITIAPLPLSALARRTTRAPLLRLQDDDRCVDDVQARAAMLLEASNAASADNIRPQVKSIISRPQEGTRGAHRRRQLEDLTAQLEALDDAKGAFYVFYASGLLTIGTVRSKDPSDSIKRRYFSAIEEAIEELSQHPLQFAGLHFLSKEDRGRLYEGWISRAKTPGDMSAALSALDMYFVVHFDAEPAGVSTSNWEHVGFAAPRIIWPHEQVAIANSIARCARTPAVHWVACCLVELARQKPFRPSDLAYATLGDVHEYRSGHVVVDIRKHHGQPSSKTEASERALEFLNAERQIPILKAYVEQEVSRGRDLDEPLWGATWPEARRNFRDAWALINQLAKAYTGDPGAGIYCFRHTWFSTQLEAALMPKAWQADRGLVHRVAREGGHADVTTSITWYFHLAMTTMRAHADVGLESMLDAKLTKQWTTLSQAAIYQRVSRAKDGLGGTPLVEAISASMTPGELPLVSKIFPCQPLARHPNGPSTVTLADVLTTLGFLDGKRPWWLQEDATGPLNEFELRIAEERRKRLAQHADPVDLVNVSQEKLASLHRHLQIHGTSQVVRRACKAFDAGRFEGYIDVESHEALLTWLSLLVAAGVPPSRLVIRMVEPTPSDLDTMISRFAAATRMEPCIDTVRRGYARPRAYLLLSSQDVPPETSAPSSATHMGGFCSLMVAAAIRLHLIDSVAQ